MSTTLPTELLGLEPEDVPGLEPVAAVEAATLMQILPADFPLPMLTKFVPNVQIKAAVEEAATHALGLMIANAGPEGLQRADVALDVLRASVKAVQEHFAEPTEIANRLHKSLTGARSEWSSAGEQAIKVVGNRIYTERQRLEAIAAEERRVQQAEANRIAHEEAEREAAMARKSNAPAAVVQQLEEQAKVAVAPPVPVTSAPPAMRTSTTVTTWKARIAGTSPDAEPNPDIDQMNAAQLGQVKVLLQAILDGKAPITSIAIDWSTLNARAKSDKSTLAIPGVEAFAEGGVRARGGRR